MPTKKAVYPTCPVYRCALVRESKTVRMHEIEHAEQAAEVARKIIADSPDEKMLAMWRDAGGALIGCEIIGMGTIDALGVAPRTLLRGAIIANAHSFIIAHNHPSGSTRPSREDVAMFKAVSVLASAMGIECLDSIVVAAGTKNFGSCTDYV